MPAHRLVTGVFVTLVLTSQARVQDNPRTTPSTPVSAQAEEGPGETTQKAWTARKSYFDSFFIIVKKDGRQIRATEPFEIKGDKVLFYLLVDYKKGPFTSLPLGDVDLAATEKANLKPKDPTPSATPSPKPGGALYETKDIIQAIDTPEMRAERERIRLLREESRKVEVAAPEEPQNPKPPAEPPKSPPRESTIGPELTPIVKEHRVQQGMASATVVLSWGEPDKKEESVVPKGRRAREVWTYLVRGQEPYVLTLEDDVLVQIQTGEKLFYSATLEADVRSAPPQGRKNRPHR